MKEAKESKELDFAMPGVYIYWKDDEIIKVFNFKYSWTNLPLKIRDAFYILS